MNTPAGPAFAITGAFACRERFFGIYGEEASLGRRLPWGGGFLGEEASLGRRHSQYSCLQIWLIKIKTSKESPNKHHLKVLGRHPGRHPGSRPMHWKPKNGQVLREIGIFHAFFPPPTVFFSRFHFTTR